MPISPTWTLRTASRSSPAAPGCTCAPIATGLDTDALPSDPAVRARLEAELQARWPRCRWWPGSGRARRTRPRGSTCATRDASSAPSRSPSSAVTRRARRPLGYGGPLVWIGLTVDPAAHAERIAARARAQFAAGLVDEAVALRERYDPALPAFSAIGYREAWAVVDGTPTLDEAIEIDARRNVAFARRQRTWFRTEPGIEWLDATTDDPFPRSAGAPPRPAISAPAPLQHPRQPRRWSRIVVWMSSVIVSVATTPTSREAATRTTAPVPHQNAPSQRFFPGWRMRSKRVCSWNRPVSSPRCHPRRGSPPGLLLERFEVVELLRRLHQCDPARRRSIRACAPGSPERPRDRHRARAIEVGLDDARGRG